MFNETSDAPELESQQAPEQYAPSEDIQQANENELEQPAAEGGDLPQSEASMDHTDGVTEGTKVEDAEQEPPQEQLDAENPDVKNQEALQENGTVTNDETPLELTDESEGGSVKPEDNKAVSESGENAPTYELPADARMVDSSDIDMSTAMGMDDPNFWNHHGNTKERYMDLAEHIPEVRSRLEDGESLDSVMKDPDVGATANQYFNPDNMIRVEEKPEGGYEFIDDGRHRVTAAQELGHEIPVKIENSDAEQQPYEGSNIQEVSQDYPIVREISPLENDHELVVDAPNDQFDPMQMRERNDRADMSDGMKPNDEEMSDLDRAKDDLEYAKKEKAKYEQGIKEGLYEANPEIEKQMDDAISYAEDHLEDIKNGQKYSYDRPSEYWESPEGRRISGELFSGAMDKGVGKLGDVLTGSEPDLTDVISEVAGKVADHYDLQMPTAENQISDAAKNVGQFYGENYGYKQIGALADASKDMMENVWEQNATDADRIWQVFSMRDADGNPITPQQARELQDKT